MVASLLLSVVGEGILCVGSPKVTLASVLEALPSERVAERYVPGEITSPRSGSLGT